ncbi:MAG: hypothetical protein RLZ75_3170 [Pseudomonadota bacterium]|jgi:hypothetical protein
MDVNEQIAITWITEVKKMFVRSELYFGQYNNDIDILAVSIVDDLIWDCEVKARTGSTNMDEASFADIIKKFNCPERINLISSLTGNKTEIKKKLIISKKYFGETEKTINKWKDKFNQNDIEVIYFDTVIDDIRNFAVSCSKTTNLVIQTLKLSSA